MGKKKEPPKHWTVLVADIRKAVVQVESNMNKAGNFIWRLQRMRMKYGKQIADLKREERELLLKHSGVEYTELLGEEDQEKQFNKNTEWQIRNFIEGNGVKKLK